MPDFFCPPDSDCQIASASKMYLYDGGDESPAVLSAMPTEKLSVSVVNASAVPYVFRPVDKAIYGSSDHRRGDVFFHTINRRHLIFAELKFWHVPGWFKDGIDQLKATIGDFIAAHPDVFEASTLRRAYVCNPYHPRFAHSYAESIRDFHRATRFALYPEGCISLS